MLLETYQAFEPTNYLQEYYSQIGSENRELLKFFAEAYQDVPAQATMLEFGGGPSLYSLITAAKIAKEIHFSDFLGKNIEEVRSWKNLSKRRFMWRNFFKEAIFLEGDMEVDNDKIHQRERLLRKKLSRFLLCDAFEENPIGPEYRNYYDVVSTNFVAESITSSLKVWEKLIGNICSTLKPGGSLIMTAIQGAKYYYVNGRYFHAASITEIDLLRALIKQGFNPDNIRINSIPAEVTDERAENYKGYKGIIFLKARKSIEPGLC